MKNRKDMSGMSLTRQPGPHPGDLKAIPQGKAIAMGYASPETPRKTKTFQKNAETGGTYAPGMSRKH